MRASFSKTKHIFPLLASKCRTPWWIQGMWDDVALDYCCCFLAFPVCSLQCVQGWVGVKQCCDGTVEEKWWSLPEVRVLLEELAPFCITCMLIELQVLASALFLCMTPHNSLCCLSVWLSNLQSTCAAGIPSMKHDARGRFDFLKSEIISFSLDWYREGVNIQMCNNYYRRVTLVSFHHVFTP